jgi:hypothetical protein
LFTPLSSKQNGLGNNYRSPLMRNIMTPCAGTSAVNSGDAGMSKCPHRSLIFLNWVSPTSAGRRVILDADSPRLNNATYSINRHT